MIRKIKEIAISNSLTRLNDWQLAGLLGLIGLLLTATKINEPYVIDEAAFPYAAHGIAQHGVPYFYNGETRPHDLGIWHPPLYVYLLGLFVRFAGFGHFQIRFFGLACLTLTCYFLIKIIRTIKPNHSLAVFVAPLFYITHYFILQSALIPDIDGTLEPLTMAIAFYAFAIYLYSEPLKPTHYFALILALALNFSTKLTTTLLLVPLLYLILQVRIKNYVKSLKTAAIIISGGLIGFLIWWIPVASISQLDWQFPFKFTFVSAIGKNTDESLIEKIISGFHLPLSAISWIGLSTFTLIGLLGFYAIRGRMWKSEKYSILLLFFSLTNWFIYDAITGTPFTFPKYWNISLIGVSICIGTILPNFKISLHRDNRFKIYQISMALFILVISTGLYTHKRLNISKSYMDFIPNNKLLVLSILVFSFIVMASRKRVLVPKGSTITILLVFTIISSNIGIDFAISKSNFSTRYYFGESGMTSVLNWLSENRQEQSILFSPKDIGLESGIKFFEDSQLFGNLPAAQFPQYLKDKGINLLVIRRKYDYSALVYPKEITEATQGFEKISDRNFGDFEIWRRI